MHKICLLSILLFSNLAFASYYIPDGSVTSVKRLDTAASKTASYTLTSKDETIYVSGGSFTISLPTAVGITGKTYKIVKTDTSVSNVITFSAPNNIGVGYGTSVTLNTGGEAWTVVSDGSQWQVVNHFAQTLPVLYTPTFGGFGSVTNVNVWSYRNGSMLYVQGSFQLGTVTGSVAQMTVGFNGTSGNVNINTTIMGTVLQTIGTYAGQTNASSGNILYLNTGNPVGFSNAYGNASNQIINTNGTSIASNATFMTVHFQVPISGWLN